MVIFRFKVHDLSDSRKTNESYGGLFNDSANRFMEYIDKNYKKESNVRLAISTAHIFQVEKNQKFS